jgi:hypothetical protein
VPFIEIPTDDQTDDPIVFGLAGETFACLPEWPAAAIFDIGKVIQNAKPGDPSDGVRQIGLLGAFFDMVLTDESAERFEEKMRSKDKPISLNAALKTFEVLLETYVGKDGGGSPASPTPPSPTGPGSTVPAPLLASTPSG